MDNASYIDPAVVRTYADLGRAVDALIKRRGMSLGDLERKARGLPARGGKPQALPTSTVSDAIRKGTPSKATLLTLLEACDVASADIPYWLAAWQRARTADLSRPASAVRVEDADPRRLGVHKAIEVAGASAGLPSYVRRDVDDRLRNWLAEHESTGGFVVLVGNSSVGKTRTLFEAVRAVLGGRWLYQPNDAAELQAVTVHHPSFVVWLDELQRYLRPGASISLSDIQLLLTFKALVVATMWPTEYAIRIGDLTNTNGRDILKLAYTIDIVETLSPTEKEYARQTAAADPRVRLALASAQFGMTQVLAAGPELIRRWDNAPASQYLGKAVITAAVDARRLGMHTPVSRRFLEVTAPSYLTAAQRATAPVSWMDTALEYAGAVLNDAASALTPVDAGMGEVAGYEVADFLYQYARRVRRSEPVSETFWKALIDFSTPADAITIARAADDRMRFQYAEPFYVRAAYEHHRDADNWLIDLLERQERLPELKSLAKAGVFSAEIALVELLAARNDLAGLKEADEHGFFWADEEVLAVLYRQQDVAGLLDHMHGPTGRAGIFLAALFAKSGDIPRALEILGQPQLWSNEVVTLLAAEGEEDVAAAFGEAARPKAYLLGETREKLVTHDIARYLAEVTANIALPDLPQLTQWADDGDEAAREALASLLFMRRDYEALKKRALAGEKAAITFLAKALLWKESLAMPKPPPAPPAARAAVATRMSPEEIVNLRDGAYIGESYIAYLYAHHLIDECRYDELSDFLRHHEGKDIGDENEIVERLVTAGRDDIVHSWAFADGGAAGWYSARLFLSNNDITSLETHAENGNSGAAFLYAAYLVEQGDEAGLRRRVDQGCERAMWQLYAMLTEQKRIDDALMLLKSVLDNQQTHGVERFLVEAVVQHQRFGFLAQLAASGSLNAGLKLADHHIAEQNIDVALATLRDLADTGSSDAAQRLADMVAQRGDPAEIQAEVDAGNTCATDILRQYVSKAHGEDAANRLMTYGLNADGSIARPSTFKLVSHMDYERLAERPPLPYVPYVQKGGG